jgi:hypothetical protein
MMKWFVLASLVGGATFFAPVPRALGQGVDKPVFHAESNQVLVPTFVYDKTLVTLVPRVTPKNVAGTWNWNEGEIANLPPQVFHLFQDGKEQTIQNITARRWLAYADVYDNVSDHLEYTDAPQGKWRCHDLGPGWGALSERHFYLLAYVPPPSSEGSCHRIEVRVDRPNSLVFARSQYCNTQHSASDPLNGTQFSKQMETYAASEQAGKIRLSVQTSLFYTDSDTTRIDIAIQFPWNALKHEWRDVGTVYNAYATIGILGMVYRKDGSLAARFSGLGCCSPDIPWFSWGGLPSGYTYSTLEIPIIPTAYEAQMELSPGEYELVVVLSDGSKFGRVQVPLTIDRYDGKQVGLSSVALCKRFHNAAGIEQEAAAANFAPKYLPLVSKGVQFAPSGDTRFKKGEPLFAYFEVYEPLLAGQPAPAVQTQMRIRNVKTGELKVDTGLRNAAPWIEPGSIVVPIAEEVSVQMLPAGSYRLEVQASDSAGRSTVWRTAEFTVE